MSGRDPVPITAALDDVVRSLRGPDRRQVGGLFGRWEEVVGAQVAAHVRPRQLDGTTLVVEADDAAWATQIRFLTSTVRERLAAVVDVQVDRLEVRVARRRDTPLVD
jgi:predicted nucleic acid-binding Zn ribbon protein